MGQLARPGRKRSVSQVRQIDLQGNSTFPKVESTALGADSPWRRSAHSTLQNQEGCLPLSAGISLALSIHKLVVGRLSRPARDAPVAGRPSGSRSRG